MYESMFDHQIEVEPWLPLAARQKGEESVPALIRHECSEMRDGTRL